jgi:hypothetical protein
MTSIPQSTVELQDRFFDTIKQSQAVVLEGVKAWSDAAGKLGPAVPAAALPPLPADLPTPQEIVRAQFDFAERLLATQREFVQELAAAIPAPARA